MLRALKLTVLVSLLLLLLALSFGLGLGVSHVWQAEASSRSPSPIKVVLPEGIPEEFDTLFEVWEVLGKDYVEKEALKPDKLSEGSIRGMIEALGDPYTAFIPADVYQLEKRGFQGSFEGIGAHVTLKDKELIIVAPIPGSPAEKAGIKAGDKILEINGQPTKGMTLNEAVLKIRGPQGTTVRLLILHPDETRPELLEIKRASINLDTVFLAMLPEGIAHIRLAAFSQRTPEELVAALRQARKEGARGVLLDLRLNPGGLLDASVAVASQFLEGGVVVSEVDNKGNRRFWPVRAGGVATKVPLVVLADKSSASGSEVVIAALQDYGRAPLIGSETTGKGSVNIIRELSDGSALFVTTARWFSPKGRLIEGAGLTPDISVPMTEEDRKQGRDPQLERAIQFLREKAASASGSLW